jgi:GNAT superfamily N-acetyltransferase
VRQLTVADLTDIIELQEAVTAGLPVGFIRSKTESELLAYLDGTLGVAYGVVERGIVEGAALLAMALLRIPDENHPNNGLPFPLVPAEDWPLCACFLENTMVLPAARGRGYQRTLLDARLSRAASAKMRWICAGVQLQNSVSWANLLAEGMAIAGIRFDPGYPVIGVLGSFDALLTSDPSDQVSVRAHDHTGHQAALQDGYIGVGLARDGAVLYQRLSSHGVRGTTSEADVRAPGVAHAEKDAVSCSDICETDHYVHPRPHIATPATCIRDCSPPRLPIRNRYPTATGTWAS